MTQTFDFAWTNLAFGSKKPVSNLAATFIMAPRTLSRRRLVQLIKTYLPKGNVVIGISQEPHVLGLEGQPQFTMLTHTEITPLLQATNAASPKHKLYTLAYSQRDITYVLDKINFARVVLVRGSWYTAFHLRPEYYMLVRQGVPYEMVSPFADEAEALAYATTTAFTPISLTGKHTAKGMLQLAAQAAQRSYDYAGYQTGVALGHKQGGTYKAVATAHNKVVPYETYAMHHGAVREQHFSPMQDLNHYDTVHAEMQLLATAVTQLTELSGASLFINLLPCPHCARTLSQTPIQEIVYVRDHSDGYAIRLFEATGKTVRRLA